MLLRQFCPGNNLLMHIRENTDFPRQKTSVIAECWGNPGNLDLFALATKCRHKTAFLVFMLAKYY